MLNFSKLILINIHCVFIFLLQFNFDDGPEIKAPHRLGVYVKDPTATIPIATEFKLDFELEQSYG